MPLLGGIFPMAAKTLLDRGSRFGWLASAALLVDSVTTPLTQCHLADGFCLRHNGHAQTGKIKTNQPVTSNILGLLVLQCRAREYFIP